MGLRDLFRPTSRQREPTPDLYESMGQLRSDMAELQRETLALQESTLKTLRKLAKRAEREVPCEDCGKEATAASQGRPMTIQEARARYSGRGGIGA